MTVRVQCSILHSIFNELGAIFKNSEQFRAFNFTVKDGTLYINANTGIRYEARIYNVGSGSADINVLFQDVSEILPQSGEASLELEPTYVLLSVGVFRITFSLANDTVVPMLTTNTAGDLSINTSSFYSNYKTLTNVATLRKAYKLDPYLCYTPESSYIKFPTVWIRTRGCGLSMSLDRLTAIAITVFSPTSYTVSGDVAYFYNSNAVMCIPFRIPEDNNFDAVIPTNGFNASWDFEPVATALKKIVKVVGEGMCSIVLGEHGFSLRIMRKGINTVISFGDTTQLSKYTVQVPIEILFNVALLANTKVKVTYGGGKLWITSAYSDILMCVTS